MPRIPLALPLLILLTACAPTETLPPSALHLGAVLPLTGDAAQWGIPPRKGAELAVAELNAAGGIGGRQIELHVEDSACEAKTGLAAFNKLLMGGDRPNYVMGGVCSTVTLALAPIAEREKVLLVSPASTSPKITDAGDYIFRVVPSDALRGQVFAKYLYDDLHLKEVDILYVNNDGGVGNKDSFSTEFAALGGKVGLVETYAEDVTDLRAQLTKIKESPAKAIVVVSYLKDTILVMRQAVELGLAKPMYFQTEAVEDPEVLREAGAAAEGAVYILPAPAAGGAAETFAASYESKYGAAPELFAAEAYDVIMLWADAVRSSGDDDAGAEIIKTHLYGVKDYAGASGTITFDRNGDVVKPMAINRIEGGQPKLVTSR